MLSSTLLSLSLALLAKGMRPSLRGSLRGLRVSGEVLEAMRPQRSLASKEEISKQATNPTFILLLFRQRPFKV